MVKAGRRGGEGRGLGGGAGPGGSTHAPYCVEGAPGGLPTAGAWLRLPTPDALPEGPESPLTPASGLRSPAS